MKHLVEVVVMRRYMTRMAVEAATPAQARRIAQLRWKEAPNESWVKLEAPVFLHATIPGKPYVDPELPAVRRAR